MQVDSTANANVASADPANAADDTTNSCTDDKNKHQFKRKLQQSTAPIDLDSDENVPDISTGGATSSNMDIGCTPDSQ
eukprot:2100664-Alexandrium_andersonii.AAC.1